MLPNFATHHGDSRSKCYAFDCVVKANYCADVSENATEANVIWTVQLNKSLGAINAFDCKEGFVWDTNDTLRTFNQSLNCLANNSLYGHWLYEGNKFDGWPPNALRCKRIIFHCIVLSYFIF